MGCFWENGFEGTSLRDLTDCMGIAGPSLYAAFGDKRSLFKQTLEHYCQHLTFDRIARLEAALPARSRAGAFLADVIERSASDPQRRGCFLINSAIEIAPHDAEIAFVVDAHLQQVRAFFERSLLTAQTGRKLPAGVDCAQVADHLMAVLLGIRVLARTQPHRKLLTGIANAALAPLGLGDTLIETRTEPRTRA